MLGKGARRDGGYSCGSFNGPRKISAVRHQSIPPNIHSVVVSLGSCGGFLGWHEWSAEVPLRCAERVRRLLDVG